MDSYNNAADSSHSRLGDRNLLSFSQDNCRFELFRLKTFARLDLAVSPIRLAQSGFYYDEERDDIICFSCHVSKRQWNTDDRPVATTHLNISPDCLQANSRDPRNVAVTHHRPSVSDQHVTDLPELNNIDSSEVRHGENTDSRCLLSVSFSPIASTPQSSQLVAHSNTHDSGSSAPMRPVSSKRAGERTVSSGDFEMTSTYHEFNGQASSISPGELLLYHQPLAQAFNTPVQPVQEPDAFPDSSSFLGHAQRNGQLEEDSEGGGLDVRRAVSPVHASVSARLSTFTDWPMTGLPSPRSLVMAGFYSLGTSDSVRCFYCGVTLRNWRENDDPWETHVRFRFSCDYVRAVKGEDFVCQTQVKLATHHAVSSPAIESESGVDPAPAAFPFDHGNYTSSTDTASSTGRSSDIAVTSNRSDRNTVSGGNASHRATTTVKANRFNQSSPTTYGQTGAGGTGVEIASTHPSVTGRSLLYEEVQTDSGHAASTTRADGDTNGAAPRVSSNQQATAATPQAATRSHTSVSMEHPHPHDRLRVITDQNLRGLQDTNRRLRQRVTCRLCRSRPVDTIFLPCGHLCTCESCAASVTECCLCHDRIRGTAHVYME